MVPKWSVVKEGVVRNVIIWDGQEPIQVEGELIAVEEDCPVGPGWTYENGEWVAPPSDEESEM